MSRALLDSPPDAKSFGKTRLGEDLTTAHILVADDNRASRTIIAHHLRASGFNNIALVEDGYQALMAMSDMPAELVITDLIMPNVDGLELCRLLRAAPETIEVPVLVQTGSTDPDLRAKAFSNGATDLVTKPYDPRELLSRVRILLERGRLIERLSEFQRGIEHELLQAASIQEALLPSQVLLNHIRSICPLDLAGHHEASVGLGGDIWGIEAVTSKRIMIFSADFAGHGIGAALNTVRMHSFINTNLAKPNDPAVLLDQLNQFLCGVLPTGQYATMFCAILDLEACMIEYASAAAPPQLLRGAGDRPFEVIQEPGFPLGVSRSATFDSTKAPFGPGGTLLLFSDALIETPQPPEEVFTPEGLCGFVNTINAAAEAQEIRDRVLREFFSRISEKPGDDLTLIAAHYVKQEKL